MPGEDSVKIVEMKTKDSGPEEFDFAKGSGEPGGHQSGESGRASGQWQRGSVIKNVSGARLPRCES